MRAVYELNFDMLIECGFTELAAAEAAHNKAKGIDVGITAPRANGKTPAPKYVRHEREPRQDEERPLEWPKPLDLTRDVATSSTAAHYRVGNIMLTGTRRDDQRARRRRQDAVRTAPRAHVFASTAVLR